MSDIPHTRSRPSSYLHKACMNCRRRKIGCSADRPVCKECRLRPPRSGIPCKYSHTPQSGVISPPQEDGMQAMVHQLQGTSSAWSSEVFLSDPYAKQIPTQQSVWDSPAELVVAAGVGNNFRYSAQRPRYFSQTPLQHSPPRSCIFLNWLKPEMSIVISIIQSQCSLDIFLLHFSPRHFFFLDSSPFQQAFDAHPPISPLLHAMYLSASRLSSKAASELLLSEAQLLARTGDHLARAVGACHAHAILQIIQAAVLLSLYYLDAGRLVEGRYHCAGATSLAFSAGLHQLGAAPRALTPPFVFAPVAQDTSREREHIAAFWSVVLLNNYLVVAAGVPSSIPTDPSITTTLWVTKSSAADETAGDDSATLLVQASILLERTIVLIFSLVPLLRIRPPLTVRAPDAPELWALDALLEALRGHLANASTDERALVAHALVNAALVRLHAPHAHLAKCLTAAHCVAARFAVWDPTRNKADPILGPLLSVLADVCIAHLALPTAVADLHTILAALTALAPGSVLLRIDVVCRLQIPHKLVRLEPHSLMLIGTYIQQKPRNDNAWAFRTVIIIVIPKSVRESISVGKSGIGLASAALLKGDANEARAARLRAPRRAHSSAAGRSASVLDSAKSTSRGGASLARRMGMDWRSPADDDVRRKQVALEHELRVSRRFRGGLVECLFGDLHAHVTVEHAPRGGRIRGVIGDRRVLKMRVGITNDTWSSGGTNCVGRAGEKGRGRGKGDAPWVLERVEVELQLVVCLSAGRRGLMCERCAAMYTDGCVSVAGDNSKVWREGFPSECELSDSESPEKSGDPRFQQDRTRMPK
ncbi:hypothetical protein FB451DRAFT_1178059 [Mycena latifolia]|nr:hypothetical protein FB451DRAFT_1178059 [Mycena latifolia]